MSDKGDFFVVRKGATAVPNSLIHNKDLSYQALALALVSLSMPAGAKVGYRQLKGAGWVRLLRAKRFLSLKSIICGSGSVRVMKARFVMSRWYRMCR